MTLCGDTESDFSTRFSATHSAITAGITNGLHRGCQLFVSMGGEAIANVAVGEAADGMPMDVDTINLWRSAGKPMTTAALLRLVDVDDHLQKHIPEFADDSVQLRDLMTHTSGLPNINVGWPNASWDSILKSICHLRRDPDVPAAYSYFVTWFLLGETFRRLHEEQSSFGELMRNQIFEPLNMMNTWNGMSSETWCTLQQRIAQVETITLSGRRRLESLHDETFCTAASPGANLRSTAHDVGQFYEALNDGKFFRCQETLNLMKSPHRVDVVDATFKAKVRMGLGVILASDDPAVPYGFGDYCSAQTYGHGGAQCSMAFCDPEHDLVVAWVVNGFPGEPKHQQRNRAINSAVYEDLGLA